jgi:hypothetical protein
MKWSRLLPLVLAAAAAVPGLSGCVEHVENIVADKQQFLIGNFSADSLDPRIAADLAQADPDAQASFTRMEFSSVPVSSRTGRPGAIRLKISLRNQGKGLSSRLTETVQNGVPASQYYELTYRGYLSLRWNEVALYEEVAPAVWEIRKFQHFDPFGPAAAAPLRYDYTTGSTQLGRSSWEHDTCTVGQRSRAAEINPGLQGDAVILDCEYHNQRTDLRKVEWAYLPRYGVAIQVAADFTDGKVLYPIQDLKIE